MNDSPRQPLRDSPGKVLFAVRYVMPAVIVIAAFALLVAAPGENGLAAWSVLMGAGLSVALLNVLYRVGAAGDDERQAEEDAREYLDAHGHWPDEDHDETTVRTARR